MTGLIHFGSFFGGGVWSDCKTLFLPTPEQSWLSNKHYQVSIGTSIHSQLQFKQRLIYTEQFNKKVTFSHDYNEVTGEPTITSYISIVMKVSMFVCNQYDKMFCTFSNREDPAAKMKTVFCSL